MVVTTTTHRTTTGMLPLGVSPSRCEQAAAFLAPPLLPRLDVRRTTLASRGARSKSRSPLKPAAGGTSASAGSPPRAAAAAATLASAGVASTSFASQRQQQRSPVRRDRLLAAAHGGGSDATTTTTTATTTAAAAASDPPSLASTSTSSSAAAAAATGAAAAAAAIAGPFGLAGPGVGPTAAVGRGATAAAAAGAADGAAAELDDMTSGTQQQEQPKLVVFSGGTAWNGVAGSLRPYTTRVAHVLPVSDDGGSTAEIVRVLGGPAVGDIRSRCLRLADDSCGEARAVRRLLAHRLPGADPIDAKEEWYRIVEGDHKLWEGMSDPYKATIRAFLVHFHSEILMHSTERFNFQNGSVGNFFFAGARIFFKSLEAAIFLFSRVARLPEGSLVLPAIATEERITLGAQLADGRVIRGQNEISHPAQLDSPMCCRTLVDKRAPVAPLPAPIRRIFYLSHEGTHREHEVNPRPNKAVLEEVGGADAVVYAMGSLYTSIGPNLVLQGVGEAVAASPAAKVLVLNGSHDRETSTCERGGGGPMAASDVVEAVADMLNRRHTRTQLEFPPAAYVHTLLVPSCGEIEVDCERLREIGVGSVVVVPASPAPDGSCHYEPDALVAALSEVVEAAQGGNGSGNGGGNGGEAATAAAGTAMTAGDAAAD